MYHRSLPVEHENQARLGFSTIDADRQVRMDFECLRGERLADVREQMGKHGLGTLILFGGDNIGDVAGAWSGSCKNNIFFRYAAMPLNSDSGLIETVDSENGNAQIDGPGLGDSNVHFAIHWRRVGSPKQTQVTKMVMTTLAGKPAGLSSPLNQRASGHKQTNGRTQSRTQRQDLAHQCSILTSMASRLYGDPASDRGAYLD